MPPLVVPSVEDPHLCRFGLALLMDMVKSYGMDALSNFWVLGFTP